MRARDMDTSDGRISGKGLASRIPARVLIGLFVLTVASRLPFLAAGYGLDPDSLRVIRAARLIRTTGRYVSSRHPGYPVHEYVVSWLLPGGAWAINGMSACLSGFYAVFLAMCMDALAVPGSWWLAFATALVPVVYVNSTCTIDYVWAVAFVMAAAWLTLRGRMWLAGACLGLAIGARVTSGAMLVPLAILALAHNSGRAWLRACLCTAVAGLAVGALCFLPVYRRYGLHGFSYTEALGGGSNQAILRRATVAVWGQLGFVAIAAAVLYIAITWRSAASRRLWRPRQCATAACGVALALYVAAYVKLPIEAGYLAPIVPFTVLLLAMWISRAPSIVFATLLCASPFVSYGDGKMAWSGPILADHRDRLALDEHVTKVIVAAGRLPRPAVIVCGYHAPTIEARLDDPTERQHRWVYLIKSTAQLEGFRRKGYEVYYTDREIEAFQRRANGLKLRALGAHPLQLP
jgi:hypothetical protein